MYPITHTSIYSSLFPINVVTFLCGENFRSSFGGAGETDFGIRVLIDFIALTFFYYAEDLEGSIIAENQPCLPGFLGNLNRKAMP